MVAGKRKEREVTYDGLLQENLLENTLLLDTLTLEDLKKALEKAGKSVQGEPSLSEQEMKDVHRDVFRNKKRRRDQVEAAIMAYAAKLEKSENRQILKEDPTEEDNSDVEDDEEDGPALDLDQVISALEVRKRELASDVQETSQEIGDLKQSMSSRMNALKSSLKKSTADKSKVSEGQKKVQDSVQGLQQVILFE